MIALMLRAPNYRDNASCAYQGNLTNCLPSAKHYKSIQGPKALPTKTIKKNQQHNFSETELSTETSMFNYTQNIMLLRVKTANKN